MRHSVLSGVLEAMAANLRHTEDVRLFEVGPIYLPRPGEKLPDEPRRLALVMTGRRSAEFWTHSARQQGPEPCSGPVDFFDLKGVIEALVGDLHLPEVSYRPAAASYLHPGQAAELIVRGQRAGSFGQLHPQLCLTFDLGNRAAFVGELDLEAILALVPDRFTYMPVPRFPAALRDIAIIVDESVTAEQIVAEIRTAGGALLYGIRLFDLYVGESIPAGKKSLAYALTYLADDRTLTDKEVDKTHRKIEDRLQHVLKAQIRGRL